MISPYPPEECGIALYASKLVAELKKHIKIAIIANNKDRLSGTSAESGVRIVRCWRRNNPLYVFQIMEGVLHEKPDVIHVQYEYLAYGVRKYAVLFPALLCLLRLAGKPIIVTMHSVLPKKELTGRFFALHGVGHRLALVKRAFTILVTKLIGLLSHAIIVHTCFMKTTLISDYYFKEEKIKLIHHGVDAPNPKIEEDKAKISLGLAGKKVVLFFGFIIPGKGLECLIKTFSMLLEEAPNATLMIVGEYHPHLSKENPSYIGTIERLVNKKKLEEKVVFENRFVSNEELHTYISAADVIIFPYIDESIAGASGALATCALFGKPVIATDIPRFIDEMKNRVNGILVKPNDEKQLGNAMKTLIGDEGLRSKLGKNLYTMFLKRRWNKVSLMTLQIYRMALRFGKEVGGRSGEKDRFKLAYDI